MKPPVRWLEAGSDAPLGARDLLSAAADTPVFSDEIRYRMALCVAKTATLPTASVWSSLLAKGALVAAAGAAGGLLVHSLIPTHPAQLPAPLVAPANVPAAPAAIDHAAPPPVSVDSLPALQLPTVGSAPALKVDPRLAEAELLEKARALVGSNPSAALRLTAEHGRDFPKGYLRAEADLIAAQALLGMGKVAAAKERARQSLSRYPNGLYARQLREIADRR
ncbi:MAG TPA: hypothetical protein VJN18_04135 [Polyangiaceae bacterium]|nr:hypothetical protein [Polyangiaceae bacterium]